MPELLARLQLRRNLVRLVGLISFAMARFITMISTDGLAAAPSGVLTRICVTTASRLCERKLLVCSRSSAGSASMMRSIGLDGARRVQRAEHQVAGFRGRHGHA